MVWNSILGMCQLRTVLKTTPVPPPTLQRPFHRELSAPTASLLKDTSYTSYTCARSHPPTNTHARARVHTQPMSSITPHLPQQIHEVGKCLCQLAPHAQGVGAVQVPHIGCLQSPTYPCTHSSAQMSPLSESKAQMCCLVTHALCTHFFIAAQVNHLWKPNTQSSGTNWTGGPPAHKAMPSVLEPNSRVCLPVQKLIYPSTQLIVPEPFTGTGQSFPVMEATQKLKAFTPH
jgi:hypothetical protein